MRRWPYPRTLQEFYSEMPYEDRARWLFPVVHLAKSRGGKYAICTYEEAQRLVDVYIRGPKDLKPQANWKPENER